MALNVATGGNDIFYYGAYSSGDNTYNGLAGNDVFYDYGGNDTYVFNRGDGKDLLVDNDEYGSDANRILFGSGITPYDLVFSVQNTKFQGYNVSNLVISLRNTNDSLTLLGWGQRTSFSNYIELSDGSVILDSGISILRQGTSRNDVFTDIYNYNNTYIGGRGNDTYNDAAGNDTYLFSRWDGQDVIYDGYERGDELNGIQFGDVESASDLMLYYEQIMYQNQLMHNLVIRIRNTTDKITVVGWDQRGGNSNYIQLSDGSRITDASINSYISYYTLGSNVRNCIISSSYIGSADENINITGNALNNYIEGNYGNNIINGGVGIDTMAGGAGNDSYYVDDSRDRIIEGVGGGTDSVFSSASYTLSSNVENLTLIGNVSINGTGNSLNNSIVGNAYANVIDGGAGVDSMAGGYGNDKYVVDDIADVITEAAGAGTDTVYSSASYTLPADVENLVFTGTNGTLGTGNALDNAIYGNSANNALDGGVGADYLAGGKGYDSYVVDNVRDVVVEAASSGIDTVATYISYSLGANVENLYLLGSDPINATGNSLNNHIIGNDAGNIINGGAGIDTMTGGVGNDIYYVDNARDVVEEFLPQGTDRIFSSASYSLSSNVENLTLIGNVSINGTGNSLNNSIVGNAYANVIDGGAGVDSMAGGYGNDKYVVDDIADVITEAAGAGTDTVYSRISYSLAVNVENLVLCGYSQIDGTGNALGNTIYGNSANNALDGGVGADYLAGGNGDDIYIVDNIKDVVFETSASGTDTVQSFVSYSLSANVENLTLTGVAQINGIGNTLNNFITGNSAANIINGGAGIDTMAGGAGNDIYYVDNAGDLVTEGADEGTDRIFSSASYTLSSNVENLTLIGNVSINGTGNSLNNSIVGNAYANVIDGGAGADSMSGGYGNDKYVVDDMADVVIEAAGAGTDTVYSRISHALATDVENLVLCGYSQINGTGNALGNTIYGNTGNNVLDGKGGADSLLGGAGDDTYLFDLGSGLDVISDASGNDTISIGAGFSSNNAVFSRIARANDLKISFSNSLNDSITVKDWFNSINTNRIERIEFSNGGFLTDSDINLALQSMTAYRPGVIDAPINLSDEAIEQQQLVIVPVSQIV